MTLKQKFQIPAGEPWTIAKVEEMERKIEAAKEVAKEDKVIVPISTEDFSDIENTVNQYIERGTDGIRRCTLCGKPEKNGVLKNLKNHIETHIEGLSFPCQLCGKTFRSRNAYNKHKHYVHKTQFHN